MNESTTEPIGVHGQLPPAQPCGVTHGDAERLREYAFDYDCACKFSEARYLTDLANRIDAGLRSKQ